MEDAIARIGWIREDANPLEVERALLDLEEDLVAALTSTAKAKHPANVCPTCGLRCRFPGRLDDHVRNVHHGLES